MSNNTQIPLSSHNPEKDVELLIAKKDNKSQFAVPLIAINIVISMVGMLISSMCLNEVKHSEEHLDDLLVLIKQNITNN